MPTTSYYHGSPHLFPSLTPGSYVCTSMESALIWGVPWGTRDVVGDPIVRGVIELKQGINIDTPLYLYKVEGLVVPSLTNMGLSYPDVYQVLEVYSTELVGSWVDWRYRVRTV